MWAEVRVLFNVFWTIRELEDTALPTQQTSFNGTDRRKRGRFPMSTALRYDVVRQGRTEALKGTGQVLDISSKGIAFIADGPLQRDQRIRVSMAWPAKLDNQTVLKLAFEGIVLRTRGNLTVVRIERPEFRTAGKIASAPEEDLAFEGALAGDVGEAH